MLNRIFAQTLAVGTLMVLSGCADLARLISPTVDDPTVPARVAFTASVNTAASRSAADVVSLKVTAYYLRTGGTRITIGSQTLSLTSAASQAVPIPVDLATCLADAARDGGSGVAGCPVVLELSLLVNNTSVDNQTVGPLRLTPGSTADVAQPVMLFELATLEVAPSPTLPLTVGSVSTVSATLRDARGNPVTDRPVTWSSNTPSVATVDATGKVTAIGVGSAQIVATVGALTASVQANVVRPPVALTIVPAVGSGNGVVRSSPAGIDCRVTALTLSGTCTFAFPADAQVSLTSTPDVGQLFGTWGQACVGNAVGVTCTLSMAQARSVSAQFIALRRVGVSARSTDGKGRVTGPFGIDCRIDGTGASGSCTADVPDGTAVTLTSAPDAAANGNVAQTFAGWGGDCSGSTGVTCTLTPLGGDRSASAGFSGGKTVTVSLLGAGGGSVTGGSQIACTRDNGITSGSCTETKVSGATVTLTATAQAQSDFLGWGGACEGTSPTCTVELAESKNVTATFATRRLTLAITLGGIGEGAVLINGAEVCTRASGQTGTVSCNKTFDVGTLVTMTVAPGTQATFAGWSGDCASNANSCTVTMSTSRAVTATFTKQPVLLTLNANGPGDGAILVNGSSVCTRVGGPATATCTRSYEFGSVLLIQYSTTPASRFAGWENACASAGSATTCQVTMNGPRTVGVSFAKLMTLTVDAGATGSGTVRSLEATPLIDCTVTAGVAAGPRCSANVPAGTSITLRAIGNTNNALSAWGNACAGQTTYECQLTMNSDVSARASFVAGVDVELRLSGAGRGMVTFEPLSGPSQAPCVVSTGGVNVNCRFSLPSTSTEGVFRGMPVSGSAFGGFVGPCVESTGATPVPVCTYRGIGFLRVITGTFSGQ